MANPNPNLPTRFKKGQSGNPLGRPKGRISLTKLLQEALKDTECCDKPNPGGRMSAQCIIEAMIVHAVKGNAAYLREIFDRNDGPIVPPEPGQDDLMQELDELDQRGTNHDSFGQQPDNQAPVEEQE